VDHGDYPEHLKLARYLVESATARFAAITDAGHPMRDRLPAAGVAVVNAAGVVSRWAYLLLAAAILGAMTWTVAALVGQFAGLPGGWTSAITVVAVIGLSWPVSLLFTAVTRWDQRRRTTRSGSAPPIQAPVGVSPEAEVLALLRMAREALAGAARQRSAAHRLGHVARTPDGFDWLRRRDRQLFWLSLADRQVSQVIYWIELWPLTSADEG
jgi:hypothetical protein